MKNQKDLGVKKDALLEELVQMFEVLPEQNRQEVLGYIRAVRDMTANVCFGANQSVSAQPPLG